MLLEIVGAPQESRTGGFDTLLLSSSFERLWRALTRQEVFSANGGADACLRSSGDFACSLSTGVFAGERRKSIAFSPQRCACTPCSRRSLNGSGNAGFCASGSHELDPAAVTTLRSALSSTAVESASDEELVALAASARSAGLTDLATKLEGTKSRRQSSEQMEYSHDCTGTQGAHEDRISSNSYALSKEQEEAKSLVGIFGTTEAIPDSIRRLVNGPAKARWTKELQPALLGPSSTDDADIRGRFVNALRTEGLIRAGAAAELRRNMQAARQAESRRGLPAKRVRAIASFAHTFVYESREPADSVKDDVKRIQGAVKESRKWRIATGVAARCTYLASGDGTLYAVGEAET